VQHTSTQAEMLLEFPVTRTVVKTTHVSSVFMSECRPWLSNVQLLTTWQDWAKDWHLWYTTEDCRWRQCCRISHVC